MVSKVGGWLVRWGGVVSKVGGSRYVRVGLCTIRGERRDPAILTPLPPHLPPSIQNAQCLFMIPSLIFGSGSW